MENKNVLTINDLTVAILKGEMTTADAANMFEKQLNASIEAAMEKEAKENAAKVREENINKSAVKVVKAVFDFIVTSYPELIPKDFTFTNEMIDEAVNDLKTFTKEIIDVLPAGIFETAKCINNVKTKPVLTPEAENLDELLDALAKTGLLKVKPTCKHDNLKNSKDDNISKFLREIGL